MADREQHWNQVYASKSPLEVSWYQTEPRLSLQLIDQCGIGKHEPVIDVGGGASTLVDHLLEAGYTRPAVLDISSIALDHARQRLGDKAGMVEWIVGDITQFEPPHSFTLWHDRAVFHFLTEPSDRERYVSALKKTVPGGGHVIIAAFAIGGPTKCSGLDIEQYDTQKLLSVLGSEFTLLDQASETHLTPGNQEQLFSYFRLARE